MEALLLLCVYAYCAFDRIVVKSSPLNAIIISGWSTLLKTQSPANEKSEAINPIYL